MTDELVDRALVIVANNIDAWGWGPISEIEGLAEHDLAVKACAAGLAAVTPQIEARAREEGFNAALAAVYHILHKCGDPCPQCHDAIAALDPAQIAGGGK